MDIAEKWAKVLEVEAVAVRLGARDLGGQLAGFNGFGWRVKNGEEVIRLAIEEALKAMKVRCCFAGVAWACPIHEKKS